MSRAEIGDAFTAGPRRHFGSRGQNECRGDALRKFFGSLQVHVRLLLLPLLGGRHMGGFSFHFDFKKEIFQLHQLFIIYERLSHVDT